jgi:hypothetical protein
VSRATIRRTSARRPAPAPLPSQPPHRCARCGDRVAGRKVLRVSVVVHIGGVQRSVTATSSCSTECASAILRSTASVLEHSAELAILLESAS